MCHHALHSLVCMSQPNHSAVCSEGLAATGSRIWYAVLQCWPDVGHCDCAFSTLSLLLRGLHCAFLGPSVCSASLGDDLPPFPNQIFEREIV